MPPQIGLQNLAHIARQYKGTWEEHQLIQQSINSLEKVLAEKEAQESAKKPAPAPDPAPEAPADGQV
jgi:hypothetical protein